MKIFFIFSFIIPVLFSYYVYDSYDVIEALNQPKLDEYFYKVIKRSFSLALQDVYAYNEIAKNPPQPDFDQNYHQKVDVQQSIKEINHTDITLYQLYREVRKSIADLKDPSIPIQFNYKHLKLLSDLYIACPIDFVIKKTDKPELFITYNEQFTKIFEQNVADEIKENLDSPIVSINEKDPFDYIANFGGNIDSSKNPHGTLSRKFNTHNGQALSLYPLGKEDLNMIINFKNGKTLNITYAFVSNNEIQELNLNDTIIKQVEGTVEEKKYNKEEVKEVGWDEGNDSDSFKCKVDNQNQVNIIYSKNLDANTDFNKCINLIDNNNYPIIFIFGKYDKSDASQDSNPLNTNSINIPKFLIESISPLKSVKYYKANRIHEMSLEKIPVNFGDKIVNYLSEPIDVGFDHNEEIINRKNSLKNKRKPTDILIFTDGTLLSMSSLFMKIFQYYGAGIVAGYFGNPNKKNIPFDSAQSSSIYMKQKTFLVASPRGYKELTKRYNSKMELPEAQFFYADGDLQKPLEFSVTPVDEIVDLFEYLKGNTYQSFVNEAKRIFDKYKTQCNPKNKKLVLVTDECNNKFENGYTHGGFECGDDGKWTNKCVPSFCDAGYVFNYKTNKCDSIKDKIDFSKMIVKKVVPVHEKSSLNFKTIFPIFTVICILGAIIYYEYMRKNNKVKKEDENGEELITIETK